MLPTNYPLQLKRQTRTESEGMRGKTKVTIQIVTKRKKG
jgi:hypothetical protein